MFFFLQIIEIPVFSFFHLITHYRFICWSHRTITHRSCISQVWRYVYSRFQTTSVSRQFCQHLNRQQTCRVRNLYRHFICLLNLQCNPKSAFVRGPHICTHILIHLVCCGARHATLGYFLYTPHHHMAQAGRCCVAT